MRTAHAKAASKASSIASDYNNAGWLANTSLAALERSLSSRLRRSGREFSEQRSGDPNLVSSGLSLSGLLIQAAVGIAGGRGGWRTKRSGVADTHGYAAAVLDGRNLTVRGPYRRRPPLPTSMPKVPCSGRSPSRPRASSARPPATARARRCAARPAHAARRAPRRLRGVDIGGGGHARRHPRDHAHVTQFAAPSATWQSYARRPTGRAGTVTRDVPGSGDAGRARALPLDDLGAEEALPRLRGGRPRIGPGPQARCRRRRAIRRGATARCLVVSAMRHDASSIGDPVARKTYDVIVLGAGLAGDARRASGRERPERGGRRVRPRRR